MTEQQLELWFSGVISIREALQSTQSKVEHDLHMQYIGRARFELDKIDREARTAEDEKISRQRLSAAITDTIRTEFRDKGAADTRKVVKAIMQSPTMSRYVVDRQRELAERQLKTEVSSRFQSARITPAEIEKDVKYHAAQPELAFHDIEEFRGAPRILHVYNPETRAMEERPYVRSRAADREYSLKRRAEKNAQRDREYQDEKKANEALEPLVKEFGDLPAAELWAMKMKRRKAK